MKKYFVGPSQAALSEHLKLGVDAASSLKSLMSAHADAVKVAEEMGLLKGFYNDPTPQEAIMLIANQLMGGYGVEAVEGIYVSSYSQNFQIDYVNMGDTYKTTLIHDNVTDKFLIGSWGGFVETHPKRFPETANNPGDDDDDQPDFEGSDHEIQIRG